MEGLTCSVSVVDYIGADDDEPIECESDVMEHGAIEKDNGGDCNGAARYMELSL